MTRGNLLCAGEQEIRERLRPGDVASRLHAQARRRLAVPDLLAPGVYDYEMRFARVLAEAAEAFSAEFVIDAYYDRCPNCHGHGIDSRWPARWPRVQCADGLSRALCPDCLGGGKWVLEAAASGTEG